MKSQFDELMVTRMKTAMDFLKPKLLLISLAFSAVLAVVGDCGYRCLVLSKRNSERAFCGFY